MGARAVRRFVYPGLLLAINAVVAGRLFSLEYTAHLSSIEGTFIAIAREIAAHPRDLRWWPSWGGGFPFQFTYLPLLQFVVAAFIRLTHESPPLAFHQVTAFFYCVAPVSLYLMATAIARRPHVAFLAALAFSLFSPCAWLAPSIRADLGGPWNLRRLQVLAFYGEAPHIAMLAFLPLAILFLFLAIRNGSASMKLLAGIFAGLTVLSNAFGATVLAAAALSILVTIGTDRLWRNAFVLGAIGILAYVWISPLVPPSVVAAIRANSPTSGGDYRFTGRTLIGVGILALEFPLVWISTRRLALPLRFFLHFTFLIAAIVIPGTRWGIFLVPQPHRYQIVLDMGLCLSATFGAAALLERRRFRARQIAAGFLLAASALAFRHDLIYAHGLIRQADITHAPVYKAADWIDHAMPGERVMIAGADSFFFNDFSDNPQALGGHDPMLPNVVDRIANYTLYAGTIPVARDAQVSILWLRALGANAIFVPGSTGEYGYQFVHPRKFEGVLPVLWREGSDTVYGLPARSRSLAHVVPSGALVVHQPIHGLDVDELGGYVNALDDASLPEASLRWTTLHSAEISATTQPGQAVSVQIGYDPGWRAEANGERQPVERDGLGFIALRPVCQGSCTIRLTFGYSPEGVATGLASLLSMVTVLVWMLFFSQSR